MLPHIPYPFEFIHIKSLKDLPHLVIVVSLIFGIGIGVYLALQPQIFNKQAAGDSIVAVKFIPESIQVQAGRDYEAKIAVNPKGTRVNAAALNVTYNPEVISVLEITNGGFLPVQLRINNDHQGKLTLIYGSTIESHADKPGMLSVIKFKVLKEDAASFDVSATSEVSVYSKEGNVLTVFPKLVIEPSGIATPKEEIRYPDNLLLEKAFFASSEPVVRDFRESLDPKPVLKSGRVKPEISLAFIKQLAGDIFISPIVALNQVVEEKVGEIINRSEE
ncbi:hypothetical protein HYW44_01610 [Candidatus Daviesbacteria bacterium]|nr:hypothetical protein [Candidatus Daviesbacteria bacterium]